ncbi:membrane protein [Mycobacterium sp. URHB0021]
MQDQLRDMWGSVLAIAPKVILFLLILIVGWIVAKLIATAVDKILERVGFDRAVERGGVRRALARSNYDASTIVSKIVYFALLLIVLQLAFGVFGPNPVSNLISGVVAFLPNLFVALIIVVVAAAIAAAVRDIISNALSGFSYGRMLGTIASVFILGLGIIAALNQVGIALTVTLPVLVAVLATVGGILVVGVGGGLIKPMQERWENYLTTAEREGRNIRERRVNAGPVGRAASERSESDYRWAADDPTGQYPTGQYPAGPSQRAGQPQHAAAVPPPPTRPAYHGEGGPRR